MKKVLIFLGFVFTLAVAFFACKKDTVSVQTDKQEQQLSVEDQQIVDYLVSTGYDANHISVGKDGCVVEGCVCIDRSLLKAMMDGILDTTTTDNGVQERQRAIGASLVVKHDKINNIKYFVHSSVNNCNNPSAWQSAITTATQNWNNISNCRVNFIAVSQQSQANLVIASDESTNTFLPDSLKNLPSNVVARTNTPRAIDVGNVYPFLSIRKGANPTSRVMAIMHELGHTMGYKHSGPTGYNNEGDVLFGTPDPDNSTSIMYASMTAVTTFNTNDLRAARLLYPDATTAPSSLTVSVSNQPSLRTVKLTVSAPSTNYPPYWLYYERWNSAGTVMIKADYIKHDVNEFLFPNHPTGTYKYRVGRANYRKDILSGMTSLQTITVN